MRRNLPVIIIVAVLLIALVGGALMLRTSQTPTPSASQASPPSTPTANSTKGATTNSSSGRPIAPRTSPVVHLRGRADAPVLLEEFGDFQCPPCAQFHPTLKRIEREYDTRVRVSYHHLPLRNIHKNAAEAARAAEAAGMQGKFWEMHDLLYEKQQEWEKTDGARSFFLKYARTLGLNLERFTADIDGIAASSRVLSDENEGDARGVKGTPTVFLNGRELPFEETINYDKLRAAIERELAATTGNK
ncbi:MAG: thioredoxin domain-containing protein [Pyrinomonadaceae bacterium]